MPWQHYVVDTALEIDPATGEFAYDEVIVTVPRQSGKTTLLLALMVHRAMGLGPPKGKRQNILYTAQTRNHARKKFEDEHIPILDKSPFRAKFRKRLTNGSEALLFKNGSKYSIESNTEKAGHGDVLDLGLVDEAFAHIDDRTEQAMKPAMSTRVNSQFWVTSTAGKATSLYLLGKNNLGREVVEAGERTGIAYFEWRGDPEADPGDPATWWDCMPALGLTIRESKIASFYRGMKGKPYEFRRAYLNIADTERILEWIVISEADWTTSADPGSVPTGRLAIGVDAAPQQVAGAVAVCGRREDGLKHGELVDHRPGTAWLKDRVLELVRRHKPTALVIDPRGPAGPVLTDLEAKEDAFRNETGISLKDILIRPGGAEVAAAQGGFLKDLADAKTFRHRGSPEMEEALEKAVAGAVERDVGDGGKAWGRRNSTIDISPLCALTLAHYGDAVNGLVEEVEPWVMYR